ncbi:autotransporter outer membrane beta-barrel domain-containing protein [Candidatus Pelagibacter sp. Uisw_099_02]|uniref:autotransporter outer membrane beta-barrel domain-containing protein n=1 Tax=Candidatus Pelagibacter sp. Uisw_099_02 TaxID=3230981 RepID=UPI0039E931AA
MLNFFFLRKNKELIIKSVLKPKVFLILFSLFFSSLALAAALTVTWVDGRIPSGNANCTSSQTSASLNNDRTTDPHDVQFSDDGLQVFTANLSMQHSLNLSMNTLSTPFDLTSIKTDNGSNDCDDLDGFAPSVTASGAMNVVLENIQIVSSGGKFFILDKNGELGRFDLSTTNDFSTATYVGKLSFSNEKDSFALNRDGTKVFTLNSTNNAPVVTTWSLPGPYDVSSKTKISELDLTSMGLELTAGPNDVGRDIEFNDTGSAMFILMSNDAAPRDKSYIHYFRLGKDYDISTAKFAGKWNVGDFGNTSTGYGMPRGFSFSSDGMHMYIVQIQTGGGVDQINQYNLECPYGLVACVFDASASVASQVELSNQNISLNVSTIFKRFEWIKRNRKNENLSSHNININYPNPLLKSLVSKFEPSLKNNLVSLVSNTLNKEEKKKSKWSSWSIVDVSIGDFEQTLLDKAKGIKTKGITFGSDRKIGDNKFFGLAVRYADSASNIRNSVRNVDLKSLTLNIYGTTPTINNQYINTVLGLSALRFDNKYSGDKSGNRNGKQAFASINYRTKNAYSKLNITPTGKLTYGVTQLSEFTDFISQTKGRQTIGPSNQDVHFHEDTFVSGEFAGGLLFEMEKYEEDGKTFQPMGGIEIIYDLSDDITYKYQNVGSTSVNKEIISKYSKKKLKTNIGFEQIAENGLTIFFDYQRIINLNDKRCVNTGTDCDRTFINENLIIKISNSKEEDTQFAFDFDPLSNNSAKLSYVKDINNFNLKLNSNMNLFTKISDYGANIEVSNKF